MFYNASCLLSENLSRRLCHGPFDKLTEKMKLIDNFLLTRAVSVFVAYNNKGYALTIDNLLVMPITS